MHNPFGLPAYPTKWPDAERKIAYGVYTGWTKAFEAVERPPSGTTAAEILTAIRAQVKEEDSAQVARRAALFLTLEDDECHHAQAAVHGAYVNTAMAHEKYNWDRDLKDYVEKVNAAAHSWLNRQPGAADNALGKLQGEGHYRRRYIYEGIRP